MIFRLLSIATLGLMLSGCFMVPMAFVGPAASGFSTASIVQSAVTTSANYMVKKTTGKTMGQHAYELISSEILQQTYLPKNFENSSIKKNASKIRKVPKDQVILE